MNKAQKEMSFYHLICKLLEGLDEWQIQEMQAYVRKTGKDGQMNSKEKKVSIQENQQFTSQPSQPPSQQHQPSQHHQQPSQHHHINPPNHLFLLIPYKRGVEKLEVSSVEAVLAELVVALGGFNQVSVYSIQSILLYLVHSILFY